MPKPWHSGQGVASLTSSGHGDTPVIVFAFIGVTFAWGFGSGASWARKKAQPDKIFVEKPFDQ
jgi:hypothetical protein